MNNNLKKVDVKDTDIPFKIPYIIYFKQDILNTLISSILLTFPLFLIAFDILTETSFIIEIIILIIIVFSLIIGVIIYLFFFEASLEPKFKFYKKFKSHYLRKYIMKKIKCPKCQNKIYNYKPKIPTAQYYYDYSYFCSSCNTEFNLYKISEKGIRPILVIREQDKKRKN